MQGDQKSIHGSCLCGNVHFRSTVSTAITECHCSQCRKQSGYRYATAFGLKSELAIEGEDHVTWYKASATAERGFCRVCGSTLFWRSLVDDEAAILVGAIDDTSGMYLDRHIFVSDKAHFVPLNDDLPQE